MTSQAKEPPNTPQRPLYATLARRTAIAILLVVIISIPTFALYAITHEMAVTWASAAGIIGIAAVVASGRELGFVAAGITAALTPVSIVAGAVPIAAAGLMAIMCLIVGRSARLGLHRVILLIPVFMAWMLLNPPTWGASQTINRTDPDYLTWMMIVFAVGAVWPVIVLPPLLRKLHLPSPQPNSRDDTLAYTWTITVLTTVATFILAKYFPQLSGAWLIATILVLTQVGNVGTVRMTVERVIGTLVGIAVVGALVALSIPLPVLYVIGLVTMVAALDAKFGPHYWLYMAFITPTVVLLNASSSDQVTNLGEQRAALTIIGVLLVLVASAITLGYSHWENTRGTGPTEETPVIAGQAA